MLIQVTVQFLKTKRRFGHGVLAVFQDVLFDGRRHIRSVLVESCAGCLQPRIVGYLVAIFESPLQGIGLILLNESEVFQNLDRTSLIFHTEASNTRAAIDSMRERIFLTHVRELGYE
jgi:hypothetical protein